MDDYDLIAASFSAQYGIRLYTKEFKDMKWQEFVALLSGIGPDTPLGRIVQIRSEDDKDVLKGFSKEEKRIRSEWRARQAKNVSAKELDDVLALLQDAFVKMAGGIANEAVEG